jgi:CdiI immunity protein
MAEGVAGKSEQFDPADYPALRDFLPAYLHQDFGEEYGSAAEAVSGFVSEASGDEILLVKEEWKKFRADFAEHSLREKQSALEHLGSAWLPQSEDELREVDKVLARAQT